MKKMILFLIGLTLIICKETQQEDTFFKDDIPDINSFVENPFDPKSIPIIGKTKEEDILKFYPNKPNERRSFRKAQTRKIHSEICNYDREILFQQLTSNPIEGQGMVGYSGKEYIYFWVYLQGGIVACYTIEHLVMGKNGEWETGKYDMDVEELNLEYRIAELYTYWSQRSQKDRDKYGVKSFDVGNKPWSKEAE